MRSEQKNLKRKKNSKTISKPQTQNFTAMSKQELTQEEYDIIIDDARYGDLEALQEIFGELDPSYLAEIKDEHTFNTTIHMAAANGHYDVLKYLLSLLPKKKAESLINLQNNEGNTALHWAALNGHLEVVELFCDEYNADAFIKNKFNHDPIYEAENSGKEDVETYFLKKFDVEPLEDEEGNVNLSVSNEEVKVKPGHEIEAITTEQVENLQSNKDFLQERTENLRI